jgi:hypothetical protein
MTTIIIDAHTTIHCESEAMAEAMADDFREARGDNHDRDDTFTEDRWSERNCI